MGVTRTVGATVLLGVEAVLAVLGVLVHYGFTAEYGDVTDSALEGWGGGFSAGPAGLAVVLVVVAAVGAALASRRLWMRLAAVAAPVLMVVGMLAVTPAALGHKLDVQYDDTPQCVSTEDLGPGPGKRAGEASQRAFESIEHVGHFGGGGWSGVGGCLRFFVLTEDVDVLRHYRTTLPRAGWRVVEDDVLHLRAERAGMAFEVVPCGNGGVVWAGRVGVRRGATCDDSSIAGF